MKNKETQIEVKKIIGTDWSSDDKKKYVFKVGQTIKWKQWNRWFEGKITAIKKPKPSAKYGTAADTNPNLWTVEAKSTKTGPTLYTKVYLLFYSFNHKSK